MTEGGVPSNTPLWVKAFAGVGLVIVALLVVALLTGAGGEHGPRRHLSSNGPQASNAIGGPAGAQDAGRTVEVTTLDALVFEPAQIQVDAGETVTFVVTNTGRAVHEFTLGDAAMQREHAAMMAHMPAGMGHYKPNSITLQPGETGQLTWRFGESGTLAYACHVDGHYQAGMRGEIVVSDPTSRPRE